MVKEIRASSVGYWIDIEAKAIAFWDYNFKDLLSSDFTGINKGVYLINNKTFINKVNSKKIID